MTSKNLEPQEIQSIKMRSLINNLQIYLQNGQITQGFYDAVYMHFNVLYASIDLVGINKENSQQLRTDLEKVQGITVNDFSMLKAIFDFFDSELNDFVAYLTSLQP